MKKPGDAVRRWVSLTVPYAASSTLMVLVPVELAERGLLAWVALGAGAMTLMASLSSLAARRMLGMLRRWGGARTAAVVVFVASFGTPILVSFTEGAVAGALLVAGATSVGALWPVVQVGQRAVVAEWGPGWIRRAGPSGRLAAGAAAVIATGIAVSPMPLWVGSALALGMFGSVVFSRMFAELPAEQIAGAWSWRVTADNGLMALAGYGPALLYVPLVAMTAGPAWTGAAMVAYAMGAAAAPALSRVAGWARSTDPRTWTLVAAATVPLWAVAGVVAEAGWAAVLVVLVVRAMSGAALFVAEGSADVASSQSGTFASALAGRNVANAVVAAAAAAALAAGAGFWGVFGGLAATAAAAVVMALRLSAARRGG